MSEIFCFRRTGRGTIFLVLLSQIFCSFILPGEDKKEEKKIEPPQVLVCAPLGVVPGTTNLILIRGLNLTNVTEIRFAQTNLGLEVKIKTKDKTKVPDKQDAKKAGDTQLEVELKIPANVTNETISFTVFSKETNSAPHALLLLDGKTLLDEKEPNDGFRKPQKIQIPQTIRGSIEKSMDVDVFEFEGKADEKIRAEVLAAVHGSALDSILTLYDAHGHILAVNDDGKSGRDSLLELKLPSNGICFLCLQDAHDLGGPAHPYVLKISTSP